MAQATHTIPATRIFEFSPKQLELCLSRAPKRLAVGGVRSGKTTGALMYGLLRYCLRFTGCDILILRRTFRELEAGAITDLKTFASYQGRPAFDWNDQKKVASFSNGSRAFFGSCVAPGTLIDTDHGQVPIEQIKVGDLVLTRAGYKPVTWAGPTGIERTINFNGLTLTADHPIMINGKFQSLEDLCKKGVSAGSPITVSVSKSFVGELSSIGTANVPTSEGVSLESAFCSIAMSGRSLMALFRQGISFITRTATQETTLSKICRQLGAAFTNMPIMSDLRLAGSAAPFSSVLMPINAIAHVSAGKQMLPARFAALHASESFAQDAALIRNVTVPLSTEPTGEIAIVYNMHVAEQHEYIAHGTIVENCTHNRERDIEQYLGQGYPFIILDECSQFSPDAWELLISRNTVNASCQALPDGIMPDPVIWGCTNPIGPFWLYYKTLFIDRKPVGVEGATRDPDGRWWVEEAGERRCVYNPADYASSHSTVLDNPTILKRDPGIIARLNSLPPAKRDKLLFGLLDRVEGQYFDSFNPAYHVLNLRDDPDAIVWQPHQAVWAGWDWGMAHTNAIYLFTKALVRRPGGDYKLKTVCFSEIVTTGKGQEELVSMLTARCRLPGSGLPFKLSAIYFSHEKFNRQMELHSPANVLSHMLRSAGQVMVTPATRDRVGSASFVYHMLQTGELVILDTCPEIIVALPTLQRNPDRLDDVLKVDNKADDCYDAFRYGLFGQLGTRAKPHDVQERERVEAVADPLARFLTRLKLTLDAERRRQPSRVPWENRLRNPEGLLKRP